MSDILCVTNRNLCRENFLDRIDAIAACSPAGIVLREKDLPEEEYRILAQDVMEICKKHQVPCILHSFTHTALSLGADAIHLPIPLLLQMTEAEKAHFSILGASCHSVADAITAQKLGCTYLTAGHIFATDCKKDLPPRGTEFLHRICETVSIPVYAIGGINSTNYRAIRDAGAKGACIMSGLMHCENVKTYLEDFPNEL